MAEDLREQEKSYLERIEESVQKAEDRVLFPEAHTVSAEICGQRVELRPLPIKYAKILASKLQKIIRMAQEKGNKDWQERADEIIADALCDCLAEMARFYKLVDVDTDAIQSSMSLAEVKAIVLAQAKINEDDDFLLMPLQAIIDVISNATQAAREVRDQSVNTDKYKETLAILRESAKSGE